MLAAHVAQMWTASGGSVYRQVLCVCRAMSIDRYAPNPSAFAIMALGVKQKVTSLRDILSLACGGAVEHTSGVSGLVSAQTRRMYHNRLGTSAIDDLYGRSPRMIASSLCWYHVQKVVFRTRTQV
jgi:hypothetical protein